MMATPGFSRDFMGSEEEEEPSFNPEAAQRIQSKILRYRTQVSTVLPAV